MLGAIMGDMIGSLYERRPAKTKEIRLFDINNRMTDDSYLTIEVARVLLNHYPFDYKESNLDQIKADLMTRFRIAVQCHPYAGWGASFFEWARVPDSLKKPYYSYGNGSAMRISPVGWMAKSIEEVKILSKTVSEITHNHPEGLKGGEAVAMCVYLALQGKSKEKIGEYIKENYYPRLAAIDYNTLLKTYEFDVSCQGSVPEAIYCFLISSSLEDAIRTAISIGGDSDTITAMTGSIAEAYYQRDELSELESEFMYRFVDPNVEEVIKRFHLTIGSLKFESKR